MVTDRPVRAIEQFSGSRPASVNPLDLKIRAGELKVILPYRRPFVLGNDLAGTIVAAGSRVTRFAVGDEIYARPDQRRIGAFAELIAMNEGDVAARPATLTAEEAASLPLVGLTAWQALVERANLRPGQKVLIHAGAGGLGTIAIVSVAGPPDPAFAQELGANPVVRLAMAALSFRVRRRARRHHVRYSFLFMKADGDQLSRLGALVDAGTIRPVVDRIFDFESTRAALAYVEDGRAKAGKVVVRMVA
ncbi:NADP-dependent oxidoreductase [Actinoplanes sp. NPDC048791]|uniref:NADP-dependent oxidoreductase n=1 Tax=Actinoplanes sp. NPDC048791 TaxID=3154623 RepID=UPI0033D93690